VLVRRGLEVVHIVSPGKSQPHALNKMARIEGERVTYPLPQREMF
jgi:hypothetical protein